MIENKKINYVLENTINRPLDTLWSKKSYPSAKIISAIAVAILSLISIGVLAIYSYKYFQNRKVISLHKKLVKAVEEKNLQAAKSLLEKYPHLKTNINVYFFKKEKSPLSTLLPRAVLNKDLEMVKLLLSYGASPDARTNLTIENAFCEAILSDHFEIVKCLAEKANLAEELYESALLSLMIEKTLPNKRETEKFLIGKGLKISLDTPFTPHALRFIREHHLNLQDTINQLNFFSNHPSIGAVTKRDYLKQFYPHVLIFYEVQLMKQPKG